MDNLPEPLKRKNQEQFERVTASIESALCTLEESPKLKATVTLLSELAGVSRRTLYNREWPIAHLKIIRDRRQLKKKTSSSQEETSEVSDEEKIENLQEQNAVLFYELENERRENDKLKNANRRLKDIIERLSSDTHLLTEGASSLSSASPVEPDQID